MGGTFAPTCSLRKDAAMAVLMILEVEGGTTEQYDRVDELLGVISAENAPEGLISHTAGLTDTGLFVADVWESPQDIDRFFETKLGAALQGAGVQPAPPRILPVHNHLHGSGSEEAVIVVVEIDGMTGRRQDGPDAAALRKAAQSRRRQGARESLILVDCQPT
jgi:hypothetical protein